MKPQSVPDRRLRLTACIACAAFTLAAVPAPLHAAPPPRLPVEAFATLPVMGQVAISPGGRYVAAMMLEANRKYGVVIFDLEQLGTKPPLRASAGDWHVNWLRWKTDERLIVSARYPHVRGLVAVLETRMIAVNADGSALKWLVQPRNDSKAGFRNWVQIADSVVSFLPDDPQHILVAFNEENPRRPRLYRVNVHNDRKKQLEPGLDGIQRWVLDQQGRVRLAQGYNYDDVNDEGYKTFYRTDANGKWQLIWDDARRNASFNPIIFDKSDADVVYVTSDHENGRLGLYRYRISSGEFIERLFLHPEVDLDEIIFNPVGTEIEGIRYVTAIAHTEWFSPRMAAIHADIRSQLPGWSVRINSRSRDDSRMAVLASAPDHSGRYFLYEPATKKLQYFSYTYPDLDEYDLAKVTPVTYKARDGLEIPAYLTLPPGVTNPPARPLPAVVMPHGGPEARDYGGFEPDVQMLANRGYAVLQMNFRGSAGYGSEFKEAGRKEWGEAMQDDVTDGTRWLIEAGVADPARICVVGGSYGGYAALMGVVKEPSLYRCAVSVNGVTDLPDLIYNRLNFVGGRSSTARRIGHIWSDRKKLASNSPARRAKDVGAPVLLVHGSNDRVVPVAQSRKMADALKSAGKPYRYVELKDEEHWLTQGPTRMQYFQELESFLAQQLE